MKSENLKGEKLKDQTPKGQPVYVKFAGTDQWYALELRGTPGAFVPLGWLPDSQHDQHYDNETDWKAFHKATADAFDDLYARTAYINAAQIDWIRQI